ALMKQQIRMELATSLFLFMLFYTAAMLAISVTVGRLGRMDRETRGALSLATVMMNVGNFGLPLAYFAFGDRGLNVSILTFVLFNIPLGTLAIVIAQGAGAPIGKALTNTFKIPIFHGVVLAFLLKWLNVHVPAFILNPISLLGQAAIPLMLVLLGMQLARTRLNVLPGFLSLASFLRLIVAPAVAWLITELLGIRGLTRDVVVLQTSTPSAVLPLLYSLRFGTRPDLVASAILVTTTLSAATLTVLLYLLH
ncbi:MAG TPA: AEC family transporter, partial [Desulfuromonadales bacterium]|nr:AEC family transporter [Desulfuromonadales bacterium]